MTRHDNPLLAPWDAPFGLPPFTEIRPEHFAPAFEQALAAHRAEVDAIAADPAAPTFENTVAALDASGRLLARVESAFTNLTRADTSGALQAVEREMAPRLAAHHSAIALDAALFARLDAVHARREAMGLEPEALRLVERLHRDFVLAGARLPEAGRARQAAIDERLAVLHTRFSQNVLADEAGIRLALREDADLAGLPAWLRAAARQAAEACGEGAPGVITLSRSLVVPFLTFSSRRDLRELAFKAWVRRGGNDGPRDNRPVAREILALRQEQARLHGFTSYADFALVDRMAGTPGAVASLLDKVWGPAVAKAAREREALEAMARSLGETHAIEPWDWRYYAEKVRAARYGLDDAALKPYFSLERMQAAAFDVAGRLFGIAFRERPDIAAYHPDVRVFEVQEAGGRPIGVFLADHYARPSKRSGAWMSAWRWQSGEVLPVIANHNNFAKAPAGEPTLLSADDVRTLFHEFGHGLHGLLSRVRYERLSGTRVLRDFVELPSQLFEHWAFEPSVLARHARHHETGEAIPTAMAEALARARRFNQGFETVEYAACALVDMALHAAADPQGLDLDAFEAAELARIGMPREIVMRHRLPHFSHLFGGSGYAAGYYVYLWAEVLDADGFGAFTEAGDPFDPPTAARLRRFVYSSGATLEPAQAFRAFRGRDPEVGAMLAKRGLLAEAGAA
jgi:peptidyl-dipeptidase Dcp